MALKEKMVFAIVILVLFCSGFFIFSNHSFSHCFTDDEIFDDDFSSKANVLGCELSAWGRERTYYSFYVVYEGNTNNLLDIVLSLKLKRVQLTSIPIVDMDQYEKSMWWVPPSASLSNLSYTCFEKEIRQENVSPLRLIKCRAELINNTLFVHQVGDIQSLRKQLKNNKNPKRFLL